MVPDPLREPALFAARVAAVAAEEGARFILPTSEASLLALLEHSESFPPGAIPWPPLETVRAICDKQRVLAAAPDFGIGVPRQMVLQAPGDARFPLDLIYPVVAKPVRSVGESAGRREKLGAYHAGSPEALQQVLAALPAAAFPLLVQERVVGPGVGVFLLLWDGQLRAAFAHRRLREKPPSGGVSVYSESAPLDVGLAGRAFRLLQALGWQGVAMIEFKVDERTGEPVLMEVNGRFWGSLQLSIDAGVDFPRLLLECAEGHPPPAPAPYRVGVRLRWWWGDVDQLMLRLRRTREELCLPSGAATGRAALRDFLRLRLADHAETFRWDDPRPFLFETRRWLADTIA